MINKGLIMLAAGLKNTFALRRGGGGGAKRMAMTGLFAVIFAYFLIMVGTMFWFMAKALNEAGQADAVPALVLAATAVFAFVMSTMRASSFLYAFKDFDLLVSLPAPFSAVLFSKIAQFYVSELLVCAFIYAPGMWAFGVVTGAGAGFWLLSVVLFFVASLAPMAVGAALSFPLAYLAGRSRMTNLLMIVGTMALVVIAMTSQRAISNLITGDAAAQITSLARLVSGVYPPALWFSRFMAFGEITPGLLFVLMNVIVFAAFLLVFARLFARINAMMTERKGGAAYKEKPLRQSGVFASLLKRELRQYFGNYIYVTNTAVGVVLFTVMTVSMLFFDQSAVLGAVGMEELASAIYPAMLGVAAFCACMGVTTAPCLNVEGKTLWILKSCPLSFADVAKAKLALSVCVCAPVMMIDGLVLSVKLGFGPVEAAGMLAATAAFACFASMVGLISNLHFPKLEWKTPVHAVKQSFSVVTSILLNMLAAALVMTAGGVAASVLGFGAGWAAIAAACLLFAASAAMWAWLMSGGAKLFDNL